LIDQIDFFVYNSNMNQEKKTITDNYHIYDSGKVKYKICTEFFDTFLINTMKAHIETQHHEFYLVKQAILLLTRPQVSGKETLSDISKLGITNIETEKNSVLDFKNLTIKGLFSKKEDDYVYMIQFDIVFYNESISQKRFCLSTISINSQKFHLKYDSTELIFIELQTQEQLLLKFAELVRNYKSEFEIVSSQCKEIVKEGMYDGGLVILPIKNIKRPVPDVDFTSYYPHDIIQNNILLEKCIPKDSTNPNLNVVIDNDIVYDKFLPHNNNINNIEVVSSVIAFCKATLKIMIDFMKEQEFIVVYEDTDSIFCSLPESYFTELDTKNKINKYLKQIMKSTYLKMAYEKTMYLFLIFGKKHYIVITHLDVPNLDILNLLLKDLKIIKHNVPEFYKLVVKKLIYSSLGFNKDFSIRQEEIDQKELVIQIITNYVNKKETLLDLFVLIAKFDSTYASVLAVDFVRLLNKDLLKE
ncbi:13149_t:CDS:2, partial [Cetraspora pellucida]